MSNYRTIALTQGKFAIVDEEDYEYLIQWEWKCSGRYASRYVWDGKKVTHILMHRIVANTPKGMRTDHINHDGFDNRKSNLRICTQSQNCHNKRSNKDKNKGASKYKGVYFSKLLNKWHVQINIKGKNTHLGVFIEEEDAAIAYNVAAQLFFNEYAYLNNV